MPVLTDQRSTPQLPVLELGAETTDSTSSASASGLCRTPASLNPAPVQAANATVSAAIEIMVIRFGPIKVSRVGVPRAGRVGLPGGGGPLVGAAAVWCVAPARRFVAGAEHVMALI